MGLTIEQIANKQVTIGVIGLGYVGFPLALVFAEASMRVIGFDIDESKAQAIERVEATLGISIMEGSKLLQVNNLLRRLISPRSARAMRLLFASPPLSTIISNRICPTSSILRKRLLLTCSLIR